MFYFLIQLIRKKCCMKLLLCHSAFALVNKIVISLSLSLSLSRSLSLSLSLSLSPLVCKRAAPSGRSFSARAHSSIFFGVLPAASDATGWARRLLSGCGVVTARMLIGSDGGITGATAVFGWRKKIPCRLLLAAA